MLPTRKYVLWNKQTVEIITVTEGEYSAQDLIEIFAEKDFSTGFRYKPLNYFITAYLSGIAIILSFLMIITEFNIVIAAITIVMTAVAVILLMKDKRNEHRFNITK